MTIWNLNPMPQICLWKDSAVLQTVPTTMSHKHKPDASDLEFGIPLLEFPFLANDNLEFNPKLFTIFFLCKNKVNS
jgi:hypothetical protein